MSDIVHKTVLPSPLRATGLGATGVVAILLGVLMPIVSAIVFPTYMHQMPHPSWEWARLLELPFVCFEIAVIMWAGNKGFDRGALWKALPRDIRIAFVPFMVGVFGSSIVISNNPAASLTMSLITVVHVIFALAIYHLFRNERGPLPGGGFLFLHGCGLAVLALYTSWWFSFPPPPEQVMGGVIEWRSALPGFISVRHFGSWTGVVAAGFAAHILFARPQGLHAGHLFYWLAATLTIWSGTRAAILAIIVATALLVFFLRKLPSWHAIAKACVLTGLALAAAWVFVWDADPAFLLFTTDDFANLESASSTRNMLWSKAFDLWTQSPVLGWGTGSFFWEGKPWTHTQPHNVIVQFLMSWGLIGAIGGFWVVGRGIGYVHKAAIVDRASLGWLAMFYALLFQSLLEGMLHYPRFIISIITLGALILARPHWPRSEQTADADGA